MERVLDKYFPTTISDIIIKLITPPILEIITHNNECVFHYNGTTKMLYNGESSLYENLVFLDKLEKYGGYFQLNDYCSTHNISYNTLTKVFFHTVKTKTIGRYKARQTFTMKILDKQLIEICKELQRFSDYYEQKLLHR